MESIVKFKLLMILPFLIISFGAAFLPWILARKFQQTAVLFSVLNCLACGVVIGAAFSHLLADAQEDFDEYFEAHNIDDSYPYNFLISAFSLLLLTTLEQILVGEHSHSHISFDDHSKHNQEKNVNHEVGITMENNSKPISDTKSLVSKPEPEQPKTASTRAYIFLIGLGLHSLFEGMGMGAASSEGALLTILIAKGIAIGIGAGELEGVAAILTSLAAGSFFYIGLIEILPHELQKPEKKKLKLLALFVGWGLMAFLALYA